MALDLLTQQLVDALSPIFQRVPSYRRFTITQVQRNIVVGTVGTGRKARRGQIVPVGNEVEYVTGEVYELEVGGTTTQPIYRLGRKLISRNPPHGINLFAPLPIPVLSVVTDPDNPDGNPISLVTERASNNATGANGEPFAQVHVIYRTLFGGAYSAYKTTTHLAKVKVDIQKPGSSIWQLGVLAPIAPYPLHRAVIGLPEDTPGTQRMDADDLSVPVTLPDAETGGDYLYGYWAHWRIDGEIVIGKLTTVASVLTLAILTGGRGLEGTTAAAHLTGATLELQSGIATIDTIEPGAEFNVRAAFVNYGDVQGGPSIANVLLTWHEVEQGPPDTLDVEMLSNGFHLKWTRPMINGVPQTSRLTYRVWRNTTNSLTDAHIVVDRIMATETDVPASNWPHDESRAAAFWFGVQAIDAFGNESDVLWDKDDTPPPAPGIDSWVLGSDDVNVIVVYTALDDTEDVSLDRGFSHFAVYRCYWDGDSYEGETFVGIFGGPDIHGTATLTIPVPLDREYLFQVASVDWAGNVSALVDDDSHWKPGLPDLFVSPGIRNGNMQVPNPRARTRTNAGSTTSGNPTVTVTGGAFTTDDYGTLITIAEAGPSGATYYGTIDGITNGTTVTVTPNPSATVSDKTVTIGRLPGWWRLGAGFPNYSGMPGNDTDSIPSGWTIAYETVGGISGDRVLHIHIPAGNYTTGYGLLIAQTVAVPFSRMWTGMHVNAAYKISTGGTAPGIGLSIVNQIFEDDFAQVAQDPPLATMAWGPLTVDNTWRRVAMLSDVEEQFGNVYTGTTFRFGLMITAAGNPSQAVDVYIDDITTDFYN